ncbi:hypothetical protein E2C01_061250 [Portunus trituberculatus]|uniref:Uncharacterized protein n=1 Tax=Portunus trituberculatus TaxID=210409 RepID=A0A5B7HBX3_PORTR|nr:hypothetical protein [Portunus trituberculatus]
MADADVCGRRGTDKIMAAPLVTPAAAAAAAAASVTTLPTTLTTTSLAPRTLPPHPGHGEVLEKSKRTLDNSSPS